MPYLNLSLIQTEILEILSRNEPLTRWQITEETGIRLRSLRDSIRRLKERDLVETEYGKGNFKYRLTKEGLETLKLHRDIERERKGQRDERNH